MLKLIRFFVSSILLFKFLHLSRKKEISLTIWGVKILIDSSVVFTNVSILSSKIYEPETQYIISAFL